MASLPCPGASQGTEEPWLSNSATTPCFTESEAAFATDTAKFGLEARILRPEGPEPILQVLGQSCSPEFQVTQKRQAATSVCQSKFIAFTTLI